MGITRQRINSQTLRIGENGNTHDFGSCTYRFEPCILSQIKYYICTSYYLYLIISVGVLFASILMCIARNSDYRSVTEFGIRTGLRNQVLWVRAPPLRPILCITHTAEWSSMEAHKVHTLEIAGSNPASATNYKKRGTYGSTL